MSGQLSTPRIEKQLARSISRRALFILIAILSVFQTSAWAQGSDIERKIEPLSAIDLQFMDDQRAKVADFAGRLGRRMGSSINRDIETLQIILDNNWVRRDDELTLQAMGVVLGDIINQRLGTNWVVYRDRAGRSRALRYRQQDDFIFPVTMISRRYSAGANTDVKALYDKVVADLEPKLPGAAWRN